MRSETIPRAIESKHFINSPFTVEVGRKKQCVDKPSRLEVVERYFETYVDGIVVSVSPPKFLHLKLFIGEQLFATAHPTGKQSPSARVKKTAEGAISVQFVKKYTDLS